MKQCGNLALAETGGAFKTVSSEYRIWYSLGLLANPTGDLGEIFGDDEYARTGEFPWDEMDVLGCAGLPQPT